MITEEFQNNADEIEYKLIVVNMRLYLMSAPRAPGQQQQQLVADLARRLLRLTRRDETG